jgi:mono/diheme cytochrome c family protein
MKKIILAIILISFIVSSCSKKEEKTEIGKDKKKESVDLVSTGKAIFNETSNLTGLKCSDCHSDGTNSNNLNTKYFSDVIGASKRSSVYCGTITGDDVKKKGAGSTICWETYLKMGRPITADEINALNSYFESLKGDVKESKYTCLVLPVQDKAKLKDDQVKIAGMTANIQNGENKFKETCNFCHGSKTIKHIPSLFEDFDGNLKSIVFHIRFGAKFMPFYCYERLSDQDVADISEYILKNQKK